MVLLSAQSLGKMYGERTLFENVSFDVREGERIGLIGVNGAGKTTLLSIFTGEAAADSGRAYVSREINVGHMRQHVQGDLSRTMYEEALSVFAPLEAMNAELSDIAQAIEQGRGDTAALVARQHRLGEAFAAAGGYTYKSRLRSTLKGVGFPEEDFSLPLHALSGGQRSKVQLARLLLSDAQVLLLDEPTNHLDTASSEWLENYLLQFRGAFIVVSHDRYFLDRVTNRTLEIENGRLSSFAGGYTRYARHKARELEIRARHRENTLHEIGRIEGIIAQQKQWNRERNLRAAQSKQKIVARLRETLDEPVRAPDITRCMFAAEQGSGDDVLIARGLQKSFGDKHLFTDVSLHVRRGEHVFLLGPNGCGKTTLIKTLIKSLHESAFGDYTPDDGWVTLGPGVKTGYYDQTQERLNPANTVLEEVWNAHRHLTQTQVRNALAAFLFRGDDVFKTIDVLSGGERARVALVKLMLQRANFLLLDEPTNHLDIASREAFENALEAYDGTLLIVSHDRYLINKLAHRILYFNGQGGISEHQGDYDSYVRVREEERAKAQEPEKLPQWRPAKNEYARKKEAAARIRSLRARMRRTEAEIEKAEDSISRMDAELQGPETAADYARVMQITREMEAERVRLERLYQAWEEDGAELDALSGQYHE
ncbi:MAG: ribosomal protection-like ABC-F family protein [Bacillota bacterium]